VLLLLVHGKNGYANAPECNVLTLPTLLLHMIAFKRYTGELPQLNRLNSAPFLICARAKWHVFVTYRIFRSFTFVILRHSFIHSAIRSPFAHAAESRGTPLGFADLLSNF